MLHYAGKRGKLIRGSFEKGTDIGYRGVAMNSNNKRTTVLNKVIDSGKRAVAGVLSFVMHKWNSLQKETKKVLGIFGATALVLIIAVIVLGVRLSGVTKELKNVQAMSVSLQDELDVVKADMEREATDSFYREIPEVTVSVVPTQTPMPVPTATPEPEKYIVCVDAGHGDWDGGAVLSENGVEKRIEKEDNLWMAALFRDALKTYGVEVVMTRETDVYLGLSERARIANAAGADVLISFHRNSFDGTADVNGVEFWIHNSRPVGAETLAQAMLDEIVAVGGLENRGVKYGTITSARDNYAINREANMTSMIVELGFITSEADNAAYDANGKAYAEGMAKAVYEWLEENHDLVRR